MLTKFIKYLCMSALNGNGRAHKGAGFGLYKPRPKLKSVLVYQDDARVLQWWLKQPPKPFCILCIPVYSMCIVRHCGNIFWFIFSFVASFILWALIYTLHCGELLTFF